MIQYFFIQPELEPIVSELQSEWLASSSNAFICMRGVYELTENEIEDEETTILKQTPQKNEYIKKGFVFIDENLNEQKAKLKYFLLEGELTTPQKETAKYFNVITFDSNIDASNFITENNLI
jgi:hypothetical protein